MIPPTALTELVDAARALARKVAVGNGFGLSDARLRLERALKAIGE